MLHFLLGLAGVELRDTARRAATGAIFLALGGLLLMMTAVGLLVALFLALAERNDPVVAALLTAAAAFVAAVIFLILAYVGMKRRRRPMVLPFGRSGLAPPTAPLSAMAPGAVPPPGPKPVLSGKVVLGVAAGAALIGLVLGRRI